MFRYPLDDSSAEINKGFIMEVKKILEDGSIVVKHESWDDGLFCVVKTENFSDIQSYVTYFTIITVRK